MNEETVQHPETAGNTQQIAITGASGLVGRHLVDRLRSAGHTVRRLVRHREQVRGENVYWNPREEAFDAAALTDADAVVHLAGESIVGRWSAKKKAAIRDSRINGTRLLCDGLAALEGGPRTLVCASAVGYYGSRGDEILTEQCEPGRGFLADVAREWEAAADPARAAGLRVVHVRIGIVLSREGGALPLMLKPFKLGVGGKIGSGQQYMSWIHLSDLVGIFCYVLHAADISGPVNAVAPEPVTNAEFTRTLGDVLKRPTVLPVPRAPLRLVMGEMADEMLLASVRAVPRRLNDADFTFAYPTLAGALAAETQ